ncbi:MAG: tRNA (guanosine(37)-N1)-methyltransferase TrmD [Elusimicrobia bacterium]|nr:tRNA (guanosine(37)-N1)-methyltransferase TrmD [Candidatus Liberimonas magnetica]
MNIDILSIFPDMFEGPLSESLIKKARDKKIVNIKIHNIRSFTKDKHKSVDDRPFGGGPGMVFKPDPIYEALRSLGAAKSKNNPEWPKKDKPVVIYLSPQGKTLDQKLLNKFTGYKHIILLCGHYEGVDERVLKFVNQEISIGDYVLTGGELPAMVFVDSLVRLLPGVVKEKDSITQDSFWENLLDYPNYTRPVNFRNMAIPDILLTGNHALIAGWRKEKAILNTLNKRPDLLKKARLSGTPLAVPQCGTLNNVTFRPSGIKKIKK